jgi:hypothetical protein
MKKKLSLDVDALAVSSFEAGEAQGGGEGTVHGRRAIEPTPPQQAECTCFASCDCPSAYYWCGDGFYTLYSCRYTQNASCILTHD